MDRNKFIRKILILLITILLINGLFGLVQLVKVSGSSMQPTLQDGDHLILDSLSYKIINPKYKDIVVVNVPGEENRKIIKRVIGVSGDHVVIKDNSLYINGVLVSEKYIKEPMSSNSMDVVVPKDSFFVMGDNRNNSDDSRDPIIGSVKKKQILGRIICVKGNPLSFF